MQIKRTIHSDIYIYIFIFIYFHLFICFLMYIYIYLFIYQETCKNARRPTIDPRCCVIQAFWPRWAALLCLESCIAVPAKLVSGLGFLQRRRRAKKTQKRAWSRSSIDDLRAIFHYTRVLAALGPVVPGILRSCSGYAGFWPWLLAAEAAAPGKRKNARRVDRRSTIYSRCCVIQAFWPRWALLCPESCMAVEYSSCN